MGMLRKILLIHFCFAVAQQYNIFSSETMSLKETRDTVANGAQTGEKRILKEAFK